MSDIYKQPMMLLPPFTVKSAVTILAEVQDYNIRMMNIPAMWRKTRGAGVKVTILDTGLPTHFDLKPTGAKSFIDGYQDDRNGHSTHVGGIIAAVANNGMGVAGIAPECETYYGAVLGADGSGTIESIINGIYWATDDVGTQIINMSLGIAAGAQHLQKLEDACNYAASKGVVIICAAGNEAWHVGQPGCYDSVIAVAAVDSKEQHAQFSDFGPEVDFAAGGVDVYSTFLNNGYAKLSGTSMASPALTGVAALIMSDSFKAKGVHLTPSEVYARLQKIAFDVGAEGFDELTGFGIPVFANSDIICTPGSPSSSPSSRRIRSAGYPTPSSPSSPHGDPPPPGQGVCTVTSSSIIIAGQDVSVTLRGRLD